MTINISLVTKLTSVELIKVYAPSFSKRDSKLLGVLAYIGIPFQFGYKSPKLTWFACCKFLQHLVNIPFQIGIELSNDLGTALQSIGMTCLKLFTSSLLEGLFSKGWYRFESSFPSIFDFGSF